MIKIKRTNNFAIKMLLKFSDYKNCLLNKEIIFKSQQRFKREAGNVYTEEINKIALNSNDEKNIAKIW